MLAVLLHFTLSEHLSRGQIREMMQHFVQPINNLDVQNVMIKEPIFFFFEFLPQVRAIDTEKFQVKGFKEIDQNLKKAHYRKHFRQMSILKRIGHIGFETLQYLTIPQNIIESIEPLTYMNLPSVISIDLTYNKIANLKPIQKMHLGSLHKLDLMRNPIGNQEIRCVGRMYEGNGCVVIWYGYHEKVRRYLFQASCRRVFAEKVDPTNTDELDERVVVMMRRKHGYGY